MAGALLMMHDKWSVNACVPPMQLHHAPPPPKRSPTTLRPTTTVATTTRVPIPVPCTLVHYSRPPNMPLPRIAIGHPLHPSTWTYIVSHCRVQCKPPSRTAWKPFFLFLKICHQNSVTKLSTTFWWHLPPICHRNSVTIFTKFVP